MSETFFIPKKTHTYADSLEAVGFSVLLDRLFRKMEEKPEVNISESGDRMFFCVKTENQIDDSTIGNLSYFTTLKFLKTKEGECKYQEYFDYSASQEQRKRFVKLREQSQNDKSITKDKLDEASPPEEYYHYDLIKSLSAEFANNSIFTRLHDHKDLFPIILESVLNGYKNRESSVSITHPKIHKDIKPDVTAVQILNPWCGKGVNRPKPDSVSPGNLKLPWRNEWLKFLGFFEVAIPRTIKVGQSYDRKIYVVEPANIDFSLLRKVTRNFRKAFRGATTVQMDINAVLIYTKTLIENLMEAHKHDEYAMFEMRPNHYVRGLHLAYFKQLSQFSCAVSNISFLALPRWIKIHGPQEAKVITSILDEHINRIKNLKEEQGGMEMDLLVKYRRFIASEDIYDLLHFFEGYASFLVQSLDKGKYYVTPFTINNLKEVISRMKTNYSEIVNNPGFQGIASCIRSATITPLYHKRSGQGFYEIRYGLAQELMRKAPFPKEFLAALSEFLQSYQAENMRVLERKNKQLRKNFSTEDLKQVTALIDKFGSEVVAKLLVAFGYAKDPRQKNADESILEEN